MGKRVTGPGRERGIGACAISEEARWLPLNHHRLLLLVCMTVPFSVLLLYLLRNRGAENLHHGTESIVLGKCLDHVGPLDGCEPFSVMRYRCM